MAVFHCPACNYLKTVDDWHLGRSADCPKCRTQGNIYDPKDLLLQKYTQNNGEPGTTAVADGPSVASATSTADGREVHTTPASNVSPATNASSAIASTMGKCPICGDATFDLADHYARKHLQGGAGISVEAEPTSRELTPVPSLTALSTHVNDGRPHHASVPAWYIRAQNVNEGMHRFHKYSKLTSFACIGFALWANDVADNWVGYLCNSVDKATQSTLWSWTAGWFSPAPPAISPMYRNYNFVMTVVAIGCTVWASRWFFHTMLMTKARAAAATGEAGSLKEHTEAISAEAQTLSYWWIGEYLGAGLLANLLFRAWCPFTIPWYPTFTSWVTMLVGVTTIALLKGYVLTQAADDERASPSR